MTDAPERIWASPSEQHGWMHGYCSDVLSSDFGAEYIRADTINTIKAQVWQEAIGVVLNEANNKDNVLCKACGHPKRNHPYRHPFVGGILSLDAAIRAIPNPYEVKK